MNRSRTITGTICLIAISAPILIAPFRVQQSLAFVREMENRNPDQFPAIESPADLIDSSWWSDVSGALEDRVPFRQQMVSLNRKINPPRSGDFIDQKVVEGKEGWLFFSKSIAEDWGTIEETRRALDLMETYAQENEFDADLFILVTPNKSVIYPEMLSDETQTAFAESATQRAMIQQWFADRSYEYRIDAWSALTEHKEKTGELIYEKGGSHFNSAGAMVTARHLINAIQPGIWDDEEQRVIWSRQELPDISKLIGDWDRTELITRIQIDRTVVELVELYENDVLVENPCYLMIESLDYYGTKHARSRSTSDIPASGLIEGQSVVIYDSYIGLYLLPTLAQFFEDVRFVHIGTTDASELQSFLESADRVIYQTAERHVVRRARTFFGDQSKIQPDLQSELQIED